MPKPAALIVVIAFVNTLAAAQPMASITVTANGGASAVVQPGEPVTIAAVLWQNQYCMAGVAGGTIVTDHAGQASDLRSRWFGLPTINFGMFQGGSRVNADFAFTPPGLLGASTPPQGMTFVPLWEYTLTLQTPGEYAVNWATPSAAPEILLYASPISFISFPVASTYIGATITVVPSPAAWPTVVAIAGLTPTRRRR